MSRSAQAVEIDITGSTFEITSVDSFKLYSIRTMGSEYWASFQWDPWANVFTVSNYGTAGSIGGSLAIELTWDQLGADVDVWLDHSSFGTCYYNNENPDWGVPGDATDNPALDYDCGVDGAEDCTLEHISMQQMPSAAVYPGSYTVSANYYDDHGHGPTTVTIKVWQGDSLVFQGSNTLNATDDTWEAFSFDPGSGNIVPLNLMRRMRIDPEHRK